MNTIPGIGLIATPATLAPCAVCGIATTNVQTTAYPLFSRVITSPVGERVEELAAGATTDLPTCDTCRALAATADEIVTANRFLVHALGTVARWNVTSALYGLAALGKPIPGPDISAARVWALVQRLSMPGAVARYVARFSPMRQSDATVKFSAREPWSAVDPDVLRDLRLGFVEMLADLRPARAIVGGPCSYCGTTSASGRRASEAWPEDGHLCIRCWLVKRDGGDWHAAFLDFIDPDRAMRRHSPFPPILDGIRPHSQTGGGNGTPWSHLGERHALRKHVADLLDVSVSS